MSSISNSSAASAVYSQPPAYKAVKGDDKSPADKGDTKPGIYEKGDDHYKSPFFRSKNK